MITKEYQRQSLAILPGALLMLVAGLWHSWGRLMEQHFVGVAHSQTILNHDMNVIISWNYGALFGAVVGSFVVYRIDMMRIIIFNSLLTIIGSILIMTLTTEFIATISSRVMCGTAYGLNILCSLIYISEISSINNRAQNISILPLSLVVGYFILSLNSNSNSSILIGSTSIACSIMALSVACFRVHQSPIMMLSKGKELKAYKSFTYFQHDIKTSAHIEIQTLKAAIILERKRPFGLVKRHNVTSAVVIILLKMGYVVFANIFCSNIRLVLAAPVFSFGNAFVRWTNTVLLAARLLGIGVGYFIAKHKTKRFQFVLSGMLTGCLVLALGIFFITTSAFNVPTSGGLIWLAPIIVIASEITFGLGIATIPDIVLAEIFPLRERQISIAIIIVLEQIVQIVLTVIHLQNIEKPFEYLTAFVGVIVLSSTLGGLALLKDTKNKPLLEVANIYKHL